jgi:hypothetical protein
VFRILVLEPGEKGLVIGDAVIEQAYLGLREDVSVEGSR